MNVKDGLSKRTDYKCIIAGRFIIDTSAYVEMTNEPEKLDLSFITTF